MEMDYKEKVAELEKNQEESNYDEKLEWFNPDAKQYKVKVLELANEYKATFDNKDIIKKRIVVKVDGKKLNWGVPVGKTLSSLFGQLMKAGEILGGLENKEVTLLVKSDGKKRDYTILEAVSSASQGEMLDKELIVDGGRVE